METGLALYQTNIFYIVVLYNHHTYSFEISVEVVGRHVCSKILNLDIKNLR